MLEIAQPSSFVPNIFTNNHTILNILHEYNCYYEQIGKEVRNITDEIPFEIPESWCWCKLGNIGEWGAGATPNRTIAEYYNGNIPWLKTGELNNGIVYDSVEKVTEKALKECSLRYNKKGDVLIAMYGATIGKLAIAGIDLTTNQACCACTPFNGIYNYYLFTFLKAVKDNFIKMGEGGAQPNISRDKIVKYLFALPPLKEQERIVKEIEKYEPLIAEYDKLEQQSTKLDSEIKDKLKKSILQYAIQGKLVEQDTNDEPASVLLEKIRAEKKAQLGKKYVDSYIYKGDDNCYYEKIGDSITNITDLIPFEIPNNWEWIRLNQVLEIARGGSPRPIQEYITNEKSGINWIKIGDTIKGEKFINNTKQKIKLSGIKYSKMIHKGDFLLTNSMSFGQPYISNIDGCIHDGWLVFSNLYNVYTVDFLYYLLSSRFAYEQFCNSVSGAVVKNLNINKVSNSLFPLLSTNEQNKIVEKLENIFVKLKDKN